MNEKEKRDFYIATCKCCLLAETMKTCPVCRFNIGLIARQVEPVAPIALQESMPGVVFVISEEYAFNNVS